MTYSEENKLKYADIIGYSRKKPKKNIVKQNSEPSIYDELLEEFGSLRKNEINEGPSYEYRKDIKNIDKSYKLHAKSVLNFYEKLRKKGLDKEASALINTYKKNYVTFKKDYDKIIDKLM